jgi:hypothetical protein
MSQAFAICGVPRKFTQSIRIVSKAESSRIAGTT